MAIREFVVANFQEGERKDLEPWLIPEQAFASLENVFFRKGVLQKRYGYSVFGQMGTFVSGETGFTNPTGNQYTKTLANKPVIKGSLKVYDDGGTQALYDDANGGFTGDGTGSVIYSSGVVDVTFTGAIIGNVDADYHYSSTGADRNIRGVFNLENDVGNDTLIAVDRDYLAVWNETYNYFENKADAGGYDIFSNKSELMWGAQYQQKLWICDGIDSSASSGIWTYDPSTTPTVAQQNPQFGSSSNYTVDYCKMMFPYYRRLVLLSTRETSDGGSTYTNHLQRARWSKIDDPASWRQDIPAEGNRFDAATNEAIVSAGIVNGVMVVAFERSIWLFEYTGQASPYYRWRELAGGLEIGTTFGRIVTEDYIAFVGRGGIYACDGVSVKKIDAKIPDFTINDIDLDYMGICHAVFDSDLDQSLFTFSKSQGSTVNDRTLVLGQDFGWFSEYDYGFTCFGRFVYEEDKTFNDITDGTTLWSEYEGITFKELADQKQGLRVLAGKTKGYVYHVNNDSENQDNDEGTGTNFNFKIESKRFNPFVQEGMKARLAYIDFFVDKQENCAFTAELKQDQDSGAYAEKTITCTGRSKKAWKRVNVSNQANFHQFVLKLSSNQLSDTTTGVMRPKIHAIKLGSEPAGSIRTE